MVSLFSKEAVDSVPAKQSPAGGVPAHQLPANGDPAQQNNMASSLQVWQPTVSLVNRVANTISLLQ